MFTNIQTAYFFQDGKTDVVANDAGERVTPALVAFIGNEKVCYVEWKI